jgi:signal transduction histidine kinase
LTETQTRLLTNLEQSGDDILQMINDLLDVERMEVGVLKLQVGIVEPETLLHECVNDSQIIASTYKQNLTISHPVLPRIQVDKSLLRRVLNNLLTNALKFTPEGGQIHVAAAALGDYLLISVADNGPGVPPADRERIFEKFTQVRGTERRGAGLGLTFCKMAIEAHGGTITVADSDSGGALFEIVLPQRQAPEANALPQEQALDAGRLAGTLYPENEVGNR